VGSERYKRQEPFPWQGDRLLALAGFAGGAGILFRLILIIRVAVIRGVETAGLIDNADIVPDHPVHRSPAGGAFLERRGGYALFLFKHPACGTFVLVDWHDYHLRWAEYSYSIGYTPGRRICQDAMKCNSAGAAKTCLHARYFRIYPLNYRDKRQGSSWTWRLFIGACVRPDALKRL